ncbi:Uncharacterised protein [Providencia rustigianii]|nr:Uncharacterised protein [Providencia rustigianii]
MKIFYKTAATATGGRSGTSTLNDGSFSVQMVRPDSDEDGVNLNNCLHLVMPLVLTARWRSPQSNSS